MGIFEKFKYANRIKSQDIFNLFGTQHLKKLKSTTKNKSARNLITLEGLDNTSLIKILNFQLKDIMNILFRNLLTYYLAINLSTFINI